MNINLTLLGQAISFSIFVWFCMKYVWPPVTAAMRERQQRIADGLAAAEQGAKAQEQAEQQVEALLNDARSQAAEIIATAQKRSNDIVDEARGTARSEGERLMAQARSEIDQELEKAKTELRQQVGSLAITGAARIVGREVDATAHNDVIQELAAKI